MPSIPNIYFFCGYFKIVSTHAYLCAYTFKSGFPTKRFTWLLRSTYLYSAITPALVFCQVVHRKCPLFQAHTALIWRCSILLWINETFVLKMIKLYLNKLFLFLLTLRFLNTVLCCNKNESKLYIFLNKFQFFGKHFQYILYVIITQ